MIELLFIRHGATAGNLQRRYIGRTDEPLCPAGQAQAETLGALHLQADRLIVSPLLRARQTAAIAFSGQEMSLEPGFAETDFGIFEGKNADELADCPAYRAWVDTGCQGPIPGGEAVSDFKARCCAAFAARMQTLPEGCRAALVVHGGVIMAICEAYALPRRDFYSYHLPNGGLLRARYEGGTLTIL